MIKAIETIHSGYRFRSRLEARWSVFFETLGIPYQYEPEGFDLSGIWYLPDFWLSQQKRWIEIKGQEPTEIERQKARLLFEATGYPVGLFYGLPGEYGGEVYGCRASDSGAGYDHTEDIGWWECGICGAIDVHIRWFDDWTIYNERTGETINACNCPLPLKDGGNTPSPRLLKAYAAAKQARFEHGETPKTKRNRKQRKG